MNIVRRSGVIVMPVISQPEGPTGNLRSSTRALPKTLQHRAGV
jgi:hypothetical protein